jgi:hypothetical protein
MSEVPERLTVVPNSPCGLEHLWQTPQTVKTVKTTVAYGFGQKKKDQNRPLKLAKTIKAFEGVGKHSLPTCGRVVS